MKPLILTVALVAIAAQTILATAAEEAPRPFSWFLCGACV